MSTGEQEPYFRPQSSPSEVSEVEITGKMSARETPRSVTESEPAWLDKFVWRLLWKVVAVAVATALMWLLARELRHLLLLLVVSLFFALAMIPGVEQMHRRWGWRRGAAVAVMYLSVVVFFGLMVWVLLPAIEEFADQVRVNGSDWIAQLNGLSREVVGQDLVGEGTGDQAAIVTQQSIQKWSGNVMGLASSGVGALFDVSIVALFAFFVAADYPRIEQALLSRIPPDRQRVYAWVSDVSIQQTGAYFYTRLLLTLINAITGFAVMLILGLPPTYALPLSVFMGFVSQFIPAIGTYIGAAIPILVVLAVEGLANAIIFLVWVLLYQWVENMFLSPRLSAKTMELNGAVAFGATVAGGAVGGPMGAFMALPLAALITAVVKNSGKRYEVVYESTHGDATAEKGRPEPA